MRTGVTLSVLLHGGALALALMGGFIRPEPVPDVLTAEVTLMSDAEFQALGSAAPQIDDEGVAPQPVEEPPASEVIAPAPSLSTPQISPSAPQSPSAPVSPAPATPSALAAPQAVPDDAPEPPGAIREAAIAPRRPAAFAEQLDARAAELAREQEEILEAERAAQAAEAAAQAAAEAAAQAAAQEAREKEEAEAAARQAEEERQEQERLAEIERQQQEEEARRQQEAADKAALEAAIAGAVNDQGNQGAVGPPLTPGELQGIMVTLTQCWNVPNDIVVELSFSLSPDGQVVDGPHVVSPLTGGVEAGAAIDAARRAVLACAPNFALPREKYAHWEHMVIEFNPRDMEFR